MLRKAIALALLIGLALLALQQIRGYLRTPEERLLWRVNAMVEDFNGGRVRQLLAGFDPDFRDESSGALKPDVHSALAGLVLSQRDPEANAFALHADWVTPFAPILSEDGARATADAPMQITYTARGTSRTWWEAKAKLEFVYRDGDWYLFRSRAVNHRDRQ